jgi:hypothetical protein
MLPVPAEDVFKKRKRIAEKKTGVKTMRADQQERLSRRVSAERPNDAKYEREENEKAKLDEKHSVCACARAGGDHKNRLRVNKQIGPQSGACVAK